MFQQPPADERLIHDFSKVKLEHVCSPCSHCFVIALALLFGQEEMEAHYRKHFAHAAPKVSACSCWLLLLLLLLLFRVFALMRKQDFLTIPGILDMILPPLQVDLVIMS